MITLGWRRPPPTPSQILEVLRTVPKQKYHGRHRDAAALADPSAPDVLAGPDISGVTTSTAPASTLRVVHEDRASAESRGGRHRPPPTSRRVPRFAGTGIILPTAAAATIVLTTTGAHLGTSAVDSAVTIGADTTAQARAQSADLLAEQTEMQQVKADALAAQTRAAQARADRAQQRVAAATAAQLKATADAAAKVRAAAVVKAAHQWVTPLDASYTLTSGFGMRWGSMHPGQDFAIPVGTDVKAMSSGTVIFAGWSGGYGNKVEIRYWDGTISWYAHNSRLKVAEGDAVTPGEVVALSGNTGHSTGPHSHIEIHLDGVDTQASAIPPIPWLRKHGNMPGDATGAPSTATESTTDAATPTP